MTANEGQHVELEGIVVTSIKGIMTVEVDGGSKVVCSISGRMRRNKIQIVVGDKVHIKISPYDLSKGFITYRL